MELFLLLEASVPLLIVDSSQLLLDASLVLEDVIDVLGLALGVVGVGPVDLGVGAEEVEDEEVDETHQLHLERMKDSLAYLLEEAPPSRKE
jgi:hypothetical protein